MATQAYCNHMMSLVAPDARGRVAGFSAYFTVFYACFNLFFLGISSF